MNIGETIEKIIQNKVKEICEKKEIPELLGDVIETDNIGEVIEKLTILHIRMWMLEDQLGTVTTDKEIADHFKQLKYLYNDNDKVILEKVAVSNVNKTAKFYLKSEPGCSCLREPETKPEDPNDSRAGSDIGTEEIQVLTLTSLFKKHNIKDIDVLTVDTEGNDLAVLQGLNFEEYRPKIIIVEYAPLKKLPTLQSEFEKVIGPNYKLRKDTGGNYIFVLND
jgi:FkbM family methyltransferase